MLQTNVDAIGEIRILTQGYQAEFGRASGMQITAITKSGTNQFRGSFYDLERNSDWNSNTWARIKNGQPKQVSKQRDFGYTLGGPIGKPGGDNKLFFFYSHEFRPRTTAGSINQFRVPTALERRGDFSQTRDNNGALFNLIRDAQSGLPCTAANTAGCFRDGGVLGRIPQNRLFQPSLNILSIWPLPNVDGLELQLRNRGARRQAAHAAADDSRRLPHPQSRSADDEIHGTDWHGEADDRLDSRLQRSAAEVPVHLPAVGDRRLHAQPVDVHRSDLRDDSEPARIAARLRGEQPVQHRALQSADAVSGPVVDERYYNRDVLEAIETPFFVDGKIMLPPTFTWGNRVANAPPNLSYPGFLNLNRTHNITVSGTKLSGNHTFKAGFYYFTAYKAENLGVGIIAPANGALSFANDTNNPLDSGFGYANAALGVFTQYQQQSKFIQGAHKYKNVEWYLQDNWKVSNRFTLDYGMRFIHQQPQHDSYQQAANFFLDQWKQSEAPQLYAPAARVAAPARATFVRRGIRARARC